MICCGPKEVHSAWHLVPCRDLAIIAGDVGYCLSVESQEAAVKAILCALVLRSQVQNEASNAYYPSRGRNSSDLGSYRVSQTAGGEGGSAAGLPSTE